jgi:hypothetical protein
MKNIFWLMLVLAIVLVACQPSPAAPDAPAPSPVPTQVEAYPPPNSAPVQPALPAGSSAYPEPGDPAAAQEISWEQAEIEILNGNVAHAVKQDSAEVIFTLKDSRILKAVPPAEGDVERLKDLCGPLCESMSIRNP